MTDEKELFEQECDCDESEIVEFSDEQGRVMKFYHLDTIEYESRFFAFFVPAEEIEGISPDELIIYEIKGEAGNEELVPIEDDDLLDAVYEEFCAMMEEDGCCDDDDCDCCHHHDDCHND